jgi:hypothetical protein
MVPAPTDGVRKPESKLKGTSRRKFLRQAGTTAGAAFAAPYVITSTALGNATTPPASDRIVMGGIGIGNMGAGDQNAFLGRPDVQYVAVCDVRRNYREAAKTRVDKHYRNSDCTAHVDFREVLARADIDAVHIATPDHWHAVMTIAACRDGKDVYLQKPETLTLREGPLMIAAARRHGRVVSGGSQRVLEDYRDIVLPCWSGELGGIVSVDIQGIHPATCRRSRRRRISTGTSGSVRRPGSPTTPAAATATSARPATAGGPTRTTREVALPTGARITSAA